MREAQRVVLFLAAFDVRSTGHSVDHGGRIETIGRRCMSSAPRPVWPHSTPAALEPFSITVDQVRGRTCGIRRTAPIETHADRSRRSSAASATPTRMKSCTAPDSRRNRLGSDDADEQIARLLRRNRRPLLTEWTDRLRAEAGDGFPEKVTAFRTGDGRARDVSNNPARFAARRCSGSVYADNETNYCPALPNRWQTARRPSHVATC